MTRPHSLERRALDLPATRERFYRYFARGADDACWIWIGRLGPAGYGQFWLPRPHRNESAHVAALRLHGVTIPAGKVVRHTCDTKLCVNWVSHLLVGTQAENRRDAVERGRTARGARNGVPRRLAADDVRAIRERVLAGPRGTATAVAREYDLAGPAYVGQIVRGERYGWVT